MTIWEYIFQPVNVLCGIICGTFFYLFQNATSVEDMIIMSSLSLCLPAVALLLARLDRRVTKYNNTRRRKRMRGQ